MSESRSTVNIPWATLKKTQPNLAKYASLFVTQLKKDFKARSMLLGVWQELIPVLGMSKSLRVYGANRTAHLRLTTSVQLIPTPEMATKVQEAQQALSRFYALEVRTGRVQVSYTPNFTFVVPGNKSFEQDKHLATKLIAQAKAAQFSESECPVVALDQDQLKQYPLTKEYLTLRGEIDDLQKQLKALRPDILSNIVNFKENISTQLDNEGNSPVTFCPFEQPNYVVSSRVPEFTIALKAAKEAPARIMDQLKDTKRYTEDVTATATVTFEK